MKPNFSNQIKKASFYIAFAFLIAILPLSLFLNIEGFPGHKGLKALLMNRLVKAAPLPDNFHDLYPQSESVIYVLGGNENALRYRFKTAVSLYHQGAAKKIFILSKPGITGYDRSLKRNLTNNEWAIKELFNLGVKKEDIEPVSIKEGFFGTLSEAKDIPKIASQSSYSSLVLVSSSYHTMRVWVSFSKFSEDKEINLFVYGAENRATLISLLFEYGKLIIYKELLL